MTDYTELDEFKDGPTIDRETAEAEFDRLVKHYRIETDTEGLDENDIRDFLRDKVDVIRAIQHGDMTVDEDGKAVYSPAASDDVSPITFRDMDGAAILSTDRKKSGHDAAKAFMLLSGVTKQPMVRFSKMKKLPDLAVCQAMLSLLGGQ